MAILILTVFRLWYCTHLELVGDEAYYWVQSRHLDMAYFDKGPAVAWTIAAGCALFGNTVFGIRFFAVLLSAATSIWLFILARWLFSDRAGLVALVIATVIPMFAVGGILMTIDPLSMFFWTVAAYAFWRAAQSNKIGLWMLSGSLVGLGTLAKYTNAAELVSFALFCLLYPSRRKYLFGPAFWTLLLTAIVVLLPPLAWNAQHHWVTLRHLAERGDMLSGFQVHPLEFLKFLGGQAGVISPLLFIGILAATVAPMCAGAVALETGFLLCLFLPLFIGYSVLSLHHAAQPNWTAPCYIAGTILLASNWLHWLEKEPRLYLLGMVAGGLALLETIALHDTRPLHLPLGKDPLDRARGWSELATEVHAAQVRDGAQFLVARTYMTASLLSFYLPGRPFVYLPRANIIRNQFSIWPDYGTLPDGSRALFVSEFDRYPPTFSADFGRVWPEGSVARQCDGRTLSTFYFFACDGLRSLGLQSGARERVAK